MKKDIYRTIAVVTGVFMLTVASMLAINYFQVRQITPLQTDVMETLKGLNEMNSDNEQLQTQIRQLDLLARKAYFVQEDHQKVGVYLLLGMAVVFVVCLRGYYQGVMHLAPKEIDLFDEWLVQSRSRKYVHWLAGVLTVVALVAVVASNPDWFKSDEPVSEELVAENVEPVVEEPVAAAEPTTEAPAETAETATETEAPAAEAPAAAEVAEATPAAAAAPTAPAAARVNHHMFRGRNSNGHSAARNIPTQWDPASGDKVVWRQTELGKQGFSSPIVHNDKIFFTGGDEAARELYCYDMNTGNHLWTLAATGIPGSPSTPPAVAGNTGYASATAATDGNYVCAIFATGDIICADMNGKRVWAKNLGVPENQYGYVSSLLVWGNSVFVQYDNNNIHKVMAFDIATGNVRWQKERDTKVCWSSPIIATVDGKAQLILMGNPDVRAYNPSTGEQLWSVSGMGGEVCPSPCSADGVIFAANEYAKLMAINGADGSILWEAGDYLPEVSSPIAFGGRVYIATSYGVLAAFDAKTGELKAEKELNMELYSSPMVVDGKVYIIGTNGQVHVMAANDELTDVAVFQTGEMTYATPAFVDGKVVVRTEQSLYCVSAN